MAYNLTRESQSILKEYATSPASFSVQLYEDNWTLNKGPKFLYSSPAFSVRSSCLTLISPLPLTCHVQALFDDIKAHRIPVDLLELFDAAKVPFYEGVSRSLRSLKRLLTKRDTLPGCMIVEIEE
jgi:hypothetical protein